MDRPDAPERATGSGGRLGSYIELTKPRLTLLALLTTLAGFYMGAVDGIDFLLLVQVLAGTAMLGAGLSALNQYFERHIDAVMPRTDRRPLPSGRMRPPEALGIGAAGCGAGIVLLYFAANPLTAGLAALTLVLYLFAYMPLKRVTPWCTVVGAIPGALPSVMGYTAAAGTFDSGAVVLFLILFLWQLPHFMAIALFYREEYRAAGMPMLPVVDPGGRRTARQIVLYSVALLVASLWPTYVGVAGLSYLMTALLLGFVFGAFAFDTAVGTTRLAARRLFLASVFYLPLLLAVMMWDKAPA